MGDRTMRNAQARSAAELLLEWFLGEFRQRIQCCQTSPVLRRLDPVFGEFSTKSGMDDGPNAVSAGTFKRFQIPNLLEHFGAETTQGVLLICTEFCDSGECVFTLWFQNGALIHAEGQGLLGRAAVKACCQCQHGWYLYAGGAIPADIPASLPGGRGVTFLLLDILRQIDEEKHDTTPPQTPSQPQSQELPTVNLEPARFTELVRLVESVREGLLMQQRAELDAWYYRHGSEESKRYRELERRALGRLYQWMASNGMMTTVNELQELPSTKARCGLLAQLLDRLSTTLEEPSDTEDGSPTTDGDGIDWTILEEDGSVV